MSDAERKRAVWNSLGRCPVCRQKPPPRGRLIKGLCRRCYMRSYHAARRG
jgi:NMD protein affecting ribosome stability and mRNA decay